MRFSSLFVAVFLGLASGHVAGSHNHHHAHLPRIVGSPDRLGPRIPSEKPSDIPAYSKRAAGPTPPSGQDTTNVPRPQLGSVAYGPTKIYHCVNPGEVALTFDDGPYYYTQDLMDTLKSAGMKATFFLVGDNFGRGYINNPAYQWRALIQRMITDGHQVASHTWTHPQLSSLNETVRLREMIYNEIALNDILGYFPTYMRPPYADCTTDCANTMATLGYHIILWDLDTLGYNYNTQSGIASSKKIWDDNAGVSNPTTSTWILLEHDYVYWSVYDLVPYIIASIKAKGFKTVTIGECLGDPAVNWYRDMNGNGVNPYGTSTSTSTSASASSTLATSTDGTCAAGVKKCPGTQCCSQYGWCGTGTTYCGTGCQVGLGSCNSGSSASSTGTSSQATGTALPDSTDGTCAAGVKKCPGTLCCSQYGWCGSTSTYCGTGCQQGLGSCT